MKKGKKTKQQMVWSTRYAATVAILLATLGIAAIIFPWNVLDGVEPIDGYVFSTKDYSGLGEFVNGVSTPFLALATFLLVFVTYRLQKVELHRTSEALADQNRTIVLQQFENTFFGMLENHHRIVEAMDLRNKKKDVIVVKRDCFRRIYLKKLKDKLPIDSKPELQEVMKVYDELQNYHKADLHHYFRFLYRILKHVKSSNNLSDKQKYKYTSILRATLSPYELVMLYYNCLHEFGNERFKPLVERYSFFKNLDTGLLLHSNWENDYHPVAMLRTGEKRKCLLKSWKQGRK